MGGLRVNECTVGVLDRVLSELEGTGISTAQARSVLHQMLGLAARHGALPANPMSLVTPTNRAKREVEVLTADQVRLLREVVSPEFQRQPGVRGPNGDLRDVVDGLLGTGARISELLALRWFHLDLHSSDPKAFITGTLVEPKKGYVARLHRQESPKSEASGRTLVLPDAVVEMLLRRRSASRHTGLQDPVFATGTGNWIAPSNIRTRLRAAVREHDLVGTTPHTLRRTVGTLIAHERGLDAARWQLGHSDPSVTWQGYVAPRAVAPDLRDLLDRFFEPNGCSVTVLHGLAS